MIGALFVVRPWGGSGWLRVILDHANREKESGYNAKVSRKASAIASVWKLSLQLYALTEARKGHQGNEATPSEQ